MILPILMIWGQNGGTGIWDTSHINSSKSSI